MTFKMGNKLRNAREELNLTQKKVCEVTGLSSKSLSDWENDVSFPKHEALAILSSIYKKPLNYFYGIQEVKPRNELPKFAFALYGEVKDLTEEQQEEILRLVKTHKEFLKK